MKPYYQDELVTLYCGDSKELMSQIEADLVITDPPYGIDFQSAWRIERLRHPKIQGDKEFPMWLFDYKPKMAMFVWCRWDVLLNMPKPKSFIVWDKCVYSMGDLEHEFGRQWEGCAFYPTESHEFNYRPVDVIRCQRIPPEQMIHPNEKPVGAIIPLIRANKGEIILDPFAGSGTTLMAAKMLNRKAIGIEIDEAHCKSAARRLCQNTMVL